MQENCRRPPGALGDARDRQRRRRQPLAKLSHQAESLRGLRGNSTSRDLRNSQEPAYTGDRLWGPRGTQLRHAVHGGRPGGGPRVEAGHWGQSRNRANPQARQLPSAGNLAGPEEGAAAVDIPSPWRLG